MNKIKLILTVALTFIVLFAQIGNAAAAPLAQDPAPDEPVHPLVALLAEFFGVEVSVIDGYHTEGGFGFGVIAQALWMSQNITTGPDGVVGDASLAGEILDAKKNKDFETFFTDHPEYFGDETAPTNWGQFKKALLNKKQNLGVVVSGHAEESNTPAQQELGNGQGNGNGNNNGNNDNNGNNGNGQGNGKNKNKGKDN